MRLIIGVSLVAPCSFAVHKSRQNSNSFISEETVQGYGLNHAVIQQNFLHKSNVAFEPNRLVQFFVAASGSGSRAFLGRTGVLGKQLLVFRSVGHWNGELAEKTAPKQPHGPK